MRTLINSPVNSLGRVRRSSLRLLRAVTVLGALLVSAVALAEPPTISLDDPVTVRIRQGQPYDPNNPGATATDPEDGPLTVVVADNPVNINVPGSYTVRYEATDTELTTVSVDRTVIIDAPPTINVLGANPLEIPEGQPYDPENPGATATDPEQGSIPVVVASNPVNVNTPGSYTVVYEATDTLGTVSANRTVLVNGAPFFNSSPGLSAQEGVQYQYDVSTGDPENDARTVSEVVAVPAWLNFSTQGNGAARLRGTPSGTDIGIYNIQIQVSDGLNAPVIQSFDLSVAAGGGVPVITVLGDNPLTVLQGQPYDPNNPGATATDPEDGARPVTVSDNPVNVNVPDTYTVTYEATDLAGNTTSATRTVIVNGAPTFTSSPDPTANEASEYLYAITVNDPEGDAVTISDVSVPAWLTFSSTGANTAELRGTPTGAEIGGPYSVQLQVSDSINPPVPQNFTLTVLPGAGLPDITLVGDTEVTIQQNAAYVDEGATASDPEDGDLTGSIVTDNPVNSSIPGTYTVSYSVADSAGNTASAERTVNVNGPPRFDSNPVTSADEDALYTYNIVASDPNDGDVITITATCSGPAGPCLGNDDWLSFSDNGDGTARLTGTPLQADVGSYDIELAAEDQSGSVGTPQSFTIVVVDINDGPVLDAPISDQSADEDVALTFNIAGNFSDEDDATLSFEVTGLPPSFSYDSVTGEISGTATDADVLVAPVTAYAVQVEASDGALSASGEFLLNVVNRNDAPNLLGQLTPLTTPEDTDIQITPASLDIDDPDPGDTFTVSLAAGENYTLVGDGTIVVPDQDYFGPLTVSTLVVDLAGDGSAPIDVLITVEPINDPPVLTGEIDAPTARENVPYSFDLAGPDNAFSFSDVEGDELTFEQPAGLPPGLTLDSTGLVSGTPTLDQSVGDFVVSFAVNDGSDSLLPVTFDLTVLAAGRVDLTVEVEAAPSAAVINQSTNWTITVTNNAPPTPDATIQNIALEATFSGEVPFALDDPAGAECLLVTSSQISCTLVGPLEGDSSREVTISGSGDQAGDVVALVTVSIPDPTPIDETNENDSDTGSLSLAASLSAGAAQKLGGVIATASAIGDFDGDGFNDLAVATGAGQATLIHLNIVDPLDENKRTLDPLGLTRGAIAATADLAAADLDGDGDLDLVTANGLGTANQVLLNAGNASFPDTVTLGLDTATSNAVAIGDVNGDALPDLVFANASPNLVATSQGSGVFQVTDNNLGAAASVDVAIADVLGDALPELIFANSDGDASVYGNSNGRFQLAFSLPTGPTTGISAADFDGDGLTDLVFAVAASVAPALPANPIFRNNGDGTFTRTATLGATPTADVITEDINLDGIIDIVALNTTGAHQIYVGDGSGGFSLNAEQFSATGAVRGGVGDINGDGRVDLAASGAAGSDVFLNDGRGNLGGGDTVPPTIRLVGSAQLDLEVEAEYVDEGATASDAIDGDITDRITVDNPVDTAVVGTYTVSYDVVDSSGNTATTVTRTVRVGVRTGTGGGGGGAIGLAFCLLMLMLTGLVRRPAIPLRSNL